MKSFILEKEIIQKRFLIIIEKIKENGIRVTIGNIHSSCEFKEK